MPLTKMQQAALDGDEAEWLRLRQENQLSPEEIELQDKSLPPALIRTEPPLTKGQHDRALGYFNTISGEPQPNGVNPLAYALGVRQAQQELEHVENSHVESVNPSISPEDSIIPEVQQRILDNLDLAYLACGNPPIIGNFQKEVIQSYLDEERDQAIIAEQTRRAIADGPTSPLIEGHGPQHLTYQDGQQHALILNAIDQMFAKLRQAKWMPTFSTGTIRVFFPEKGYGFIKPNCGGLDVWFHIQDRVNKDYFPREGESLTYLTRLGAKGTLVAKQWDSNSECLNPNCSVYQVEV